MLSQEVLIFLMGWNGLLCSKAGVPRSTDSLCRISAVSWLKVCEGVCALNCSDYMEGNLFFQNLLWKAPTYRAGWPWLSPRVAQCQSCALPWTGQQSCAGIGTTGNLNLGCQGGRSWHICAQITLLASFLFWAFPPCPLLLTNLPQVRFF